MPSFCVGFLYDNGNDKIEKNNFQFNQFPIKNILVGIITQIYFNSSKYTFPVLALHKDRIGRDMNPSEFVY